MMLILIIAMAQAGEAMEFRSTAFPPAFRGRWALDRSFCREPGPAVLEIGQQRFDRDEEHGVLRYGRLNEATDPAQLLGRFEMVEGLRLWDETIRFEIEGSQLFITRSEDPDAARPKHGWAKC